jgi:hypothetical protein
MEGFGMKIPRPALGATILLCMLYGAPASADVVLDWNEVLLEAIRVDRTAPPRAARAMACTHVSIYDSVVSLLGGFEPYHVTDGGPAGASPEAAAAGAAHAALSSLFPAQQATFDAALAASLAAIPDGPGESAGVAWGVEVAGKVLELRAGDHSDDVVTPGFPVGANWWAATPPAFAPAVLPNWPAVTPWTMTSATQFRAGPPPSSGSAEYTQAFREVRRLGRADSSSRTADQTEIALFWADGPGTATPPGHWLVIAQEVSEQRGLGLLDNARLFALLGMTEADAGIVSWDHKYYYDNWRPVTGIQHADEDGNPDTVADPGWLPLIATPPFPTYTSGHSTFSGAGARLLALFFGGDSHAFSTTSDGLPGVTRQFSSFSQAGEEAGQSRVYGGIHWQYDNTVGLSSGRALAEHVFFTQLRSLADESEICVNSQHTACLQGGRFRVEAGWQTPELAGSAQLGVIDGDSATFWFFHQGNIELTVKVLDACDGFERHWVFVSGLTNVQVLLTVTDTETGRVRRYFNPQGRVFAPVHDVGAFPCP